eukprot:NODE_132_length_18298_cov_0.443101.p3 type:complete len:538 gc:universal NODE_132_length_18298_cov_0.443101:478-2091(+)
MLRFLKLNHFFQFFSFTSLLLILILLNENTTSKSDYRIEEPAISNINGCKKFKILNSYPIHFPELRYYQHEAYSDIFMIPSDLPATSFINLVEPYLKVKIQFVALMNHDEPLSCHLLNRNFTAYTSLWNSHHHERIFTSVIWCDVLVNLVNTTLKVNNNIVQYTYNEEYELLDSISYVEMLSITNVTVDTCVIDIPQLPITMYKFLINQIFPYPVVEHSISSPFLHDISMCVSPLRGNIPYLAEWLEYYILMGITHFYIYDYQLSREGLDLLFFYQERGLVTVIPWYMMIKGFNVKQGWYYFQAAANNDCVFQFRSTSKYLMFVDPDEFVKVPFTLVELISEFERNSRYDILVEIELSNWFYSTQIDVKLQQKPLKINNDVMNEYLLNIKSKLAINAISTHSSDRWHRFESLVTLMSYKSKEPEHSRKKFIAKSMVVEQTEIHRAIPYHYTLKYELPIEQGYVMHFRELNYGLFGSKYAEQRDLIKVQSEHDLDTFDLTSTTLDTTYLYEKRKAIMSRLEAVKLAYLDWKISHTEKE